MDDPFSAAEEAAWALGYRLEAVWIRNPRTDETVHKWEWQRIRQPRVGENWLKFGTPTLYDSKRTALRALLAELDPGSAKAGPMTRE